MSLLDTIKRWFSSTPEEVEAVPTPVSERADDSLEQERRERAEQPRASIESEEGYRPSEPDREA
jgi:hypothetical protein